SGYGEPLKWSARLFVSKKVVEKSRVMAQLGVRQVVAGVSGSNPATGAAKPLQCKPCAAAEPLQSAGPRGQSAVPRGPPKRAPVAPFREGQGCGYTDRTPFGKGVYDSSFLGSGWKPPAETARGRRRLASGLQQ